jgi:hypothetical protein
MPNRPVCCAVAASLSLAFAAPALAQEASSPGALPDSPLVGKLETCTAISDDAQRLACFDREVGALVGASTKGSVRIVEQEEITEARRKLYGYTLPDAGIFATRTDEEREAARSLVSTITRVRQIGAKEYDIWIEEGDAVWRMKGTSIRFRAPEIGDKVEFEPATMGTYWIKVNGRNGVRGKRVG